MDIYKEIANAKKEGKKMNVNILKNSRNSFLMLAVTAVLAVICLVLVPSCRVKADIGGSGVIIHHSDVCGQYEYFTDGEGEGISHGYVVSGMEHTYTAILKEDLKEIYAGSTFYWRVTERPTETATGETMVDVEITGAQNETIKFTPRAGYTYSLYASIQSDDYMYQNTGTYYATAYEKIFTRLPGTNAATYRMLPGESIDFSDTEVWVYDADTVAAGGRKVAVKDYAEGLNECTNGVYTVSGFTATAAAGGSAGVYFWGTPYDDNKLILSQQYISITVPDGELSFGMADNGTYWYTPKKDETIYMQSRYDDSVPSVRIYARDGSSLRADMVSHGTDISGNRWSTNSSELSKGETYFFEIDWVDEHNTVQISNQEIPDPQAPVSINTAKVSTVERSYFYNGNPIEPEFVVTVDDITLVAGQDYTVTFENNTEPGSARATLTGIGNYTGTKKTSFHINKAPQKFTCSPDNPDLLVGESISVALNEYTEEYYAGIKTEISYEIDNPEIASFTVTETGFDVTASAIGTANIIITAAEDEHYSAWTKTFTVDVVEKKRTSINDAIVTGNTVQTYTGKEICPVLTVVLDGVTLVEGKDYEVTYSKNIEVGRASIIITGIGEYKGTIERMFQIAKADQNLLLSTTSVTLTVGKSATFTVRGNSTLPGYESSDPAVAEIDASTNSCTITAKKVGTAVITVTARATAGYKEATATVTVNVVPKAVSSLTAANVSGGVKLAWKKVADATGYIIYRKTGSGAYKKVKTITKAATVTYTDSGAKTNGTKYTFKVVPTSAGGNGAAKETVKYFISTPKISSAKSTAAKKATLKWGKNTKATGYEIQYSLKSNFSKIAKTVTIKKAATVTHTQTGLTSGKTYYVRIRAYKTVSGKKHYSGWSVKKSVKIK